ncbi:MAG: hydrogenase maturation protease [Acidimicrobiales bacterium]
MTARILVAGVGNVLRGDDGFGVEVARRMMSRSLPDGVRVVETGIAGIQLVQEVMEGTDALLVVDAVDHGRPPGTVMVIEPDVTDVELLTFDERFDILADMHVAVPERALMLIRALGALPSTVLVIGCQPLDAHELCLGLSAPVASAIEVAIAEVERCIAGLLVLSATSTPPIPPTGPRLP